MLFRPEPLLVIAERTVRERHTKAAMDRLAIFSQALSIPKDDALRLCSDICHERAGHWFSPAAWRCALCVKLAREGVPARMMTSGGGYNGCPSVNQRYLLEQRSAPASA